MRKLIVALVSIMLMLCSCTKEQQTTYTFATEDSAVAQVESLFKSHGYTDTHCDILIFEYYGEQRVASQVIKNVSDNRDYTFVATPRTEYVTVRIDVNVEGHNSKPDDLISDYIANVFYLTKGEDTKILFSTETLVSDYEPR